MRSRLLVMLWLLLPIASAQAAPVKTESLSDATDIWYVRDDALPIVDIMLSFEGAGTASDPAGKEGRAAFAAAMLTEGSGTQDALSFAQALEEKAIRIDTDVSADRLIVRVHALREHAPAAAHLLVQALTQPTLAEADMQRVKHAFGTQIALQDEDPQYLAARRFDTRAFGGHPYASAPNGTRESIAALTADDLRAYLAQYVTRTRLLMVAAGDVDGRALKSMLTPLVKQLPEGAAPPVRPIAMQGAGETITEARDFPQSVIVFAAPAVARDDPQFYTAYLLNHIVGGGSLVSRLSQTLRQGQGLVYGIGTQLDVREGVSLLRGALATRNATAPAARQAVMAELARLRDVGVTTEECNDARSHVIGGFVQEIDSTQDLSNTLLMMRRFNLGQDYMDKRASYFQSVRCEDINAMARTLLDPKRFLFVTIGVDTKEAP